MNNRRDDCGFGCMLNRYKTPLMITGSVLTAMALPFVGPAIGAGAAALGIGEAIAGGLATAGSALVGAAPAILGQGIGLIGQEEVKYNDNISADDTNYGGFYEPRPVFGKQGVYE